MVKSAMLFFNKLNIVSLEKLLLCKMNKTLMVRHGAVGK